MFSLDRKLFSFLIIWVILWKSCYGDTPRYCPEFCDCSLRNDKNLADCRARRLISPYIELPDVVEIIDLSYNDITSLEKDCFQSYVYLYNLILAHNSIYYIHLDAFATLEILYSLDLSYNHLEYLDPRIIEANRQLQVLNLEGNKFISLANQPFLRSTSLLQLNLRNSQINNLYSKLFVSMPQLHLLDVGQNLLISFQAAVFNAQNQLQSINFEGNPLNCDRKLLQEITYLEKRGIGVAIEDCKASRNELENKNHNEDLGRIELLESEEKENPTQKTLLEVWHSPEAKSSQSRKEDEDRNKIFRKASLIEEDAMMFLHSKTACNATPRVLCMKYQQCLSAVSDLISIQDHITTGDISQRYFTLYDVELAFALGVSCSMGLLILISITFLCCKSKKCRKKSRSHELEGPSAAPLVVAENMRPAEPQIYERITLQPPPVPPRVRQPRRQRRRAPNPNSQIVARSDLIFQPSGDEGNFISRLFGRPARHQYYRAINQNAATLIRTISRSNLFNGRGNNERDSESPRPQSPTAPTSQFFVDSPSTTMRDTPARPETPPPKYIDIVPQQSNGN